MSSHRRYYTLLVAAYILTIYTTSGQIRELSNLARQIFGGSLSVVVTLGLIFILAGILVAFRHSLGRRRLLPLSAVLLGYGAILWWLPVPEERFHLFQYGLLCLLCHKALPDKFQGLSRSGLSVLIVTLAGIGDELIQWIRPNRVGDIRDVLINCLAALLAQTLINILADDRSRPDSRISPDMPQHNPSISVVSIAAPTPADERKSRPLPPSQGS